MGDKPQASSPTPTPPIDDLEAVNKLRDAYGVIKSELGRIIVGQDRVIEELIIALFARGHVILEGVPGLAKTLMISSLARCLGLKFHRIQFTPDLMPSDITGTEVIQEDRSTGHRSFRFLKGPIFANVVLADEVNRITGEDTLVSDLTYDLRSGSPDFLDKMIAYTFATMAVERISDGASGRMMAIQNGCYTDTEIPDPSLGARTVDVETMYNADRFRPNYANKTGLPIFLTRV